MKTSNKQFRSHRNPGRERDSSWQAERGDFYNEDAYNRRRQPSQGDESPDYGDDNYWDMPGRDEELYGSGAGRYVPEFNYGRNRRELPGGEASGYGNENSPFMSDYERWHRHGEEHGYHDYNYGFRGGLNNDHRYDYNYYESYPSYGQGAPYGDHERSYIDKQEARGRRGIDNEDTYGRPRGEERFSSSRRRPDIRNKRY